MVTSLITAIPTDALAIAFMAPGQCREFTDGSLHEKMVPYTIIAQVLFGHYEITCNGLSEIIQPGEAFLTPANHPMAIMHRGDTAHGNLMGARWNHIHFTLFDTLDVTSLLDMPLKLSTQKAQRLGRIIQELLALETEQNSNPIEILARRHTKSFETLYILSDLAPLKPESQAVLRHAQRLTGVFAHIRDHLADPFTPADLARLGHMSLSRFHATFREHLGTTPMDYVKKLRLDEACKRLLISDDSIYDIAAKVGFTNQFHFSREFNTRFGMSPFHPRLLFV